MKRLAVGLVVLCLGGFALSSLLQTGSAPALGPQVQQPAQDRSAEQVAVLQAPTEVLAPVERSVAKPEMEAELAPVQVPEAERPEEDLLVLAVDAEGKPLANVPIDLVMAGEMWDGLYRSQEQVLTGPDGIARFKRQRKYLKGFFGPPMNALHMMDLEFGVRCALRPGGERRFAESNGVVRILEVPKPGELLRVEVRPVGWLRVKVVGPSGERGRLVPPDGITWRTVTTSEQPRLSHHQTFGTDQQSFLLGPLGLGWKLDLRFVLQGRAGALGRASADGPTIAGETLDLTVELPNSLCIEGVALDEQQEPLGQRILTLAYGPEPGAQVNEQRVISQADGSWGVYVPTDFAERNLRLGVHRDPRESAADVDLSALVDMQVDQLDVGEVVLRPTKGPGQVLASGRVVGGNGEGVKGVVVGVYAPGTTIGGGEAMAKTRTGSDGAFELLTFDPIEVAQVTVHAAKRGKLKPTQEVGPPGMVGLQLSLEKGASLAGQVLLDTAVLGTDRISLQLKGAGVSHNPSHMDFLMRYKGEFVGLREGTYRLTIEIRGTKWVLFDQEFTLASGERLDFGSIDLRGRVRAVRIKLADPSGAPIRQSGFTLLTDERKGQMSTRSSSEGLIAQLVPSEVDFLCLRHRDFGEHRFLVGDELIELTLAR